MKTIIKVFMINILCFSLFGCSNNSVKLGAKSQYEITDNIISMTIKEETLTDKAATVLLVNHTDKRYGFGESYIIEYNKNGTWYKINSTNKLNFTMIGRSLESNTTLVIEINWENVYGKLTRGKYRIIKSFYLMEAESKEMINSEDIYVCAEFTVE